MYLYRYERAAADYIEKLPVGKHSVKGVGKTEPDSSEFSEIDGARVPFGKGVKKDIKSDLLYNEYVVYDIAQVNVIKYRDSTAIFLKYLCNIKFYP